MTVLAIPLAGAAIGGALAAGTAYVSLGITLGYAAGSFIAGAWSSGSNTKIKAPRFNDPMLQSGSYGEPIPDIYGAARISGNMLWSSPTQTIKHEEDSGGGGKGGGGGGATYVTYTYTASFAIGLLAGEIDGIGRIWFDGKIWLDNRSGVIEAALDRDTMLQNFSLVTYERSQKISLYTGSESQQPDPTMESYEGAGNVPAYLGLAYIVFENIDLGGSGHKPNVTVEVFKDATPTSEYYYFDRTPTTDVNLYPTITPDGNLLVLCHNATDGYFFRLFSGMTWNELYRFYPQDFGSNNYSNPGGWECQGMCIRMGAPDDYGVPQNTMMTLWVQASGNWPEAWVVYHDGISGDIQNHKQITECAWPNEQYHWAQFNGMSAQDHDLVLKQKYYYDAVIHLRTWDNPSVVDVFGGGSLDYPGILIHGQSYNLWMNLDDKIYEYYGISRDQKQVFSQDYWDSNISGLDYDPNSGHWILFEGLGDQGKGYVYDSDWDRLLIDYYEYDSDDYPSLSSIVSSICLSAGLAADQIDVTDLASTKVKGFVRAGVMTANKVIELLQTAYFFDAVEIDKKIHFVLRDGSNDKTLADADLGAHEYGSDAIENIITDMINESELPQNVQIRYIDYDTDYQVGVQRYDVYFSNTEQTVTIDLPIILDHDDALQIAQKHMMQAHAAKYRYTLAVSWEHIDLAPGDVITADNNLMRIEQMGIAENLLKIVGISEWDSSIYQSTIEAPDITYDPILPAIIGNTAVVALDIPILSINDNNPGFYLAVYGYTSGWSGATLAYSSDGGAAWAEISAVVSASIIGRTNSTLADGSALIWDNANTVNISIFTPSGTLSSDTEANVLSNSNLAAIGSHGRWELINFLDATLESDGTYTLSGLLRGRYGTDANTGNHQGNDYFVLLEASKLARPPLVEADIGLQREYRAVSIGKNIADAVTQSFTNSALGIKPYTVVNVEGVRDTSGNLTITWVWRDRVYGANEWGDYAASDRSIEDDQSCEIDVYDTSSPPAVVRTITVSDAETTIYTAAQQTTDFGSPQSSIDMIIYQMSAVAGRGQAKEVTL